MGLSKYFLDRKSIFRKAILGPQFFTMLGTTKVAYWIPKYHVLSLELKQSYKYIVICWIFQEKVMGKFVIPISVSLTNFICKDVNTV